MIEHAYDIARDAHREQVRRSGEPYITHPVGVALVLADLGLDDVTIAAALLHDAVEDTTVTKDDIERELGRRRRHHRRRRHQARPPPVRLQGGAAGRDAAQDARGDGEGHPGPAHQARRPAPQHAHHRVAARVQAAAHRAGDARHLRAARAPARHRRHEVAARGHVVRGAPPAALRRDRADGRHPGARARGVPRRPSSPSCGPGSTSCTSTPTSTAGRSTTGRSTRR